MYLSRRHVIGAGALGAVWLCSHLSAAVVISEIHYHPPEPDGDRLEFVELWNAGAAQVELDGWRFVGGVRFTFPADPTLAAGGRLIVARDAHAFSESGNELTVVGNFSGSLANEGEEVTLVDADNSRVDAVPYDDQVPWPDADGQGFSLQRICADARSEKPDVWAADAPTPGGSFDGETCDVPAPLPPSVVISEIFYHPPREVHGRPVGGDDMAEFVELWNLTDNPVDVGGWRFIDGIEFTIPAGTIILADDSLVVARDPELMIAKYDSVTADNVVGPFLGQLSNVGERLTLVDGPQIIDSVFYRDAGDWPYSPDGEGRSLEKIFLEGPGWDPANWAGSQVIPDVFFSFEVEGPPGPFADVDFSEPGMQAGFIISLDGTWPSVLPGHSIELTNVSASRDNDRGEVWRHSAGPGGTPGSVAISFLRADANADGNADISDPLVMLRYMFLGESVACVDAVDADDSGLVDISDPLHLLRFLFLGTAPPPEPYSNPGADPTLDDLGCSLPE